MVYKCRDTPTYICQFLDELCDSLVVDYIIYHRRRLCLMKYHHVQMKAYSYLFKTH